MPLDGRIATLLDKPAIREPDQIRLCLGLDPFADHDPIGCNSGWASISHCHHNSAIKMIRTPRTVALMTWRGRRMFTEKITF